jgi:hypothetical protein
MGVDTVLGKILDEQLARGVAGDEDAVDREALVEFDYRLGEWRLSCGCDEVIDCTRRVSVRSKSTFHTAFVRVEHLETKETSICGVRDSKSPTLRVPDLQLQPD